MCRLYNYMYAYICRAKAHAANADALRSESGKSAVAAKATLAIGQKLERRAVRDQTCTAEGSKVDCVRHVDFW